jgi:hypothetical protein
MPRALRWSWGGGQFLVIEGTLKSWSTCALRAWPTHISQQFESLQGYLDHEKTPTF